MSDFKIHILTTAELGGAKAAEAQLLRQIGQAKALGQEYGHLETQLKRVQATITASSSGSIGANLKGLASEIPGIERISSVFGRMAGPVGAVAVALEGARHSLMEYAQAEEVVAKLDAALAQNALLTDQNRQRYQELASQLQETTGVADEKWISVLTRLTQFGATPQSIGMDADAVKNLAGLVGDVETAANLYSRALQGNFEMFGRYGIQIDDTGTKIDKLRKLQEDLALRGGGQLEASNRTLAGSFRNLKNNASDFFEAIGRGIAGTKVVQGVLFGLSESAAWAARGLGGAVPQVEGLTNATAGAATAMDKMKTSTVEANTNLEAQLTLIGNLVQADKNLIEAQKELELAELERQKRDNKIDPISYAQKKGAIENKSAADIQAAVEAAGAQQIAAIEQKRGELETQIRGHEQNIKVLTDRLEMAKKYETAKALASGLVQQSGDLSTDIATAKAAAQAGGNTQGAYAAMSPRARELYNDIVARQQKSGFVPGGQSKLEAAEAELADTNRRKLLAEAAQKELRSALPQGSTSGDLAGRLKAAKSEESSKAIEKANADWLALQQKKNDIERELQTNRQLSGIKSKTAAVKVGTEIENAVDDYQNEFYDGTNPAPVTPGKPAPQSFRRQSRPVEASYDEAVSRRDPAIANAVKTMAYDSKAADMEVLRTLELISIQKREYDEKLKTIQKQIEDNRTP
jgi:hypothetical protein